MSFHCTTIHGVGMGARPSFRKSLYDFRRRRPSQGGGWKKIARMEKKLRTPPPPPSRGCLRKKSCPAIIAAFGKIFTQGQFLVQKWNSLHQISLCTLACTELIEPIDHFKFVLLVEVICEGAFFFFFASRDQCSYKD